MDDDDDDSGLTEDEKYELFRRDMDPDAMDLTLQEEARLNIAIESDYTETDFGTQKEDW
jgi:hypothetical protein